MRIALIGKGKTGGEILNLYSKDQITIFDSKNPVNVNELRKCDVAIAFVPGDIFKSIIPYLIESKIPVVTGATGLDWNDETKNLIKQNNLKWISGSNFSLGMRIIHQMIKKLNLAKKLFDEYSFQIHEIHHTKKLDAPSGTALSWNNWINNSAEISHERIGDVVGDHKITFKSPFEEIHLQHQALDRKIFAKGAIWAATYLIENQNELEPGLHLFEEITENIINKQEKL